MRNVTCHGFSAGIAIGSEMSGGIENVLVENVRFTKSNKPADIKVGRTRGGYVRNITFRDILVEGPIQRAIHVDMYHYNDSPNPACPDDWEPPQLTKISNLTFVRFDGRKASYYDYKHRPNETFHFLAYPDSPIQNVYMEDVYFPTNGLAWNCSAVHGIVRAGTVEPWPPCEGFRVEHSNHLEYEQRVGFVWYFQVFLVILISLWRCLASRRPRPAHKSVQCTDDWRYRSSTRIRPVLEAEDHNGRVDPGTI